VKDNPAGNTTALREKLPSRMDALLVPLVLLAGFIARLIPAKEYFLNPDEALHYLAASQSSLNLAYKAALTNAHPPLLIVVLYFWRSLGQSELILRLPSVLAGTACCWLAYLWLIEVTDRSAAFAGLLLMSFAPSLVALSAEVRQYALLLFFVTACLFLSERALKKNSWPLMILFSLSLYGALLTHYSSLLFAITMGVYLLVRLLRDRTNLSLFAVWAAGQLGAIALIIYFLFMHVRVLRAMGMPQEIAETWLRKSIFHHGERNVAAFIAVQTLRVFTYLFSHGFVGTQVLLAFLAGFIALLRSSAAFNKTGQAPSLQKNLYAGPTPRELALLLGLPFVVNCAAAFAGIYPYGGTRHNVFLAPFAIGGAAIGIAVFGKRRAWEKSVVIVALLALCNFFPAPPPLIKARNHSDVLMKSAINYLRQAAPPDSFVLADYQSGLLLGYYGCGHGIVQLLPPLQPFAKFDCKPYSAITARPGEWRFTADALPGELAQVAGTYGLVPGTKVWLFDAGWINDLAPALSRSRECPAPHFFGDNILVCELTIQNAGSADPRKTSLTLNPASSHLISSAAAISR
jgi:4-amino-4-deoxy-L-arabinose transferase-like glycosyltransferase